MTNPNDVVNATDEFVPIQNLAGAIELQTSDGTVRFERIKVTRGLTKREYFAAMAMQGIIAAHNIYETGIDNEVNANTAVRAADALINALNQDNETNRI